MPGLFHPNRRLPYETAALWSCRTGKAWSSRRSGRIRDLSAVIPDVAGVSLLPDTISRLKTLDINKLPVVPGAPQKETRLGPCVGQVGKFICIGLNYADHAAETGATVPPERLSSTSGPLRLSDLTTRSEFREARSKPTGKSSSASSSARAASTLKKLMPCRMSLAFASSTTSPNANTRSSGQGPGIRQGLRHIGPLGPWLVTPDEVRNLDDLKMWLEVDGHRYQNGSTKTMVYKVPFLISYLSRFMSLQPGDVISTGTPPGVGMGQKPPVYLKGGEVMTLGSKASAFRHNVSCPDRTAADGRPDTTSLLTPRLPIAAFFMLASRPLHHWRATAPSASGPAKIRRAPHGA